MLRPGDAPLSTPFRLPAGSSQGKHSRWYLALTWAEVRLTNTNEKHDAEIDVDANSVPVSRFVIKTVRKSTNKCSGQAQILVGATDYVDGDRTILTCKRRFFVRFGNYLPTTNIFTGVGVKGGRNTLNYSAHGSKSFVKSVRILKRSLLVVRDKGWPNLTMSNFRVSKNPVAGEPFTVTYVIKRKNPSTSVPSRKVSTSLDLGPFGQKGLHILSKPLHVGTLTKPRAVSARLQADAPGDYKFYVFTGSNTNSPGARLRVTVGERPVP